MKHFVPPTDTTELTFPALRMALREVGDGAEGFFYPNRKQRLARFELPATNNALIDAVWAELGSLKKAAYSCQGLFIGKLENSRVAELERGYDQVFGEGAFAQEVKWLPYSDRSSQTACITVRGHFGWLGPYTGWRKIFGSNHPLESTCRDYEAMELGLCAFSGQSRRARPITRTGSTFFDILGDYLPKRIPLAA